MMSDDFSRAGGAEALKNTAGHRCFVIIFERTFSLEGRVKKCEGADVF